MSEVAAHALSGEIGVFCRGPRVGRAGDPPQMVMGVIDDGLHPVPAWSKVPEAKPCLVAKFVWKTEAARHEVSEMLIGQSHDWRPGCAVSDPIFRRRQRDFGLVHDPRFSRLDPDPFTAVPEQIDVAMVIGVGFPTLTQYFLIVSRRCHLEHSRNGLRRLEGEGAAHSEGERL